MFVQVKCQHEPTRTFTDDIADISKTRLVAIVSNFSCVLRPTMVKPIQKRLKSVQHNRMEVRMRSIPVINSVYFFTFPNSICNKTHYQQRCFKNTDKILPVSLF